MQIDDFMLGSSIHEIRLKSLMQGGVAQVDEACIQQSGLLLRMPVMEPNSRAMPDPIQDQAF